VIIAINIFVRGVKLMNGLSGRRMINYFSVAVNVWRIKLVEIVADAKGGKIKISRDLKEYIEDTYGSDSD
jgi:hypothetical protein